MALLDIVPEPVGRYRGILPASTVSISKAWRKGVGSGQGNLTLGSGCEQRGIARHCRPGAYCQNPRPICENLSTFPRL